MSRGKYARAIPGLILLIDPFSIISFLIRLTLYRVDTAQVYVEFMCFSFMTEHAVLEEMRRIYSHQTSRSYLRPCSNTV